MVFRLGELFSGAGGMSWGAFNAGANGAIRSNGETFSIEHAWANDMDLSACKSYVANLLVQDHGDADDIPSRIISVRDWIESNEAFDRQHKYSVFCGLVEEFTKGASKLDDIDGLAFGFPCNDFSSVGERKGLSGDFGPLYLQAITVLNKKTPRWFVAENVEGLLYQDKRSLWPEIKSQLENAGNGYVVTEHLYHFEQYGVPQRRSRLVIVGISMQDSDDGIKYRVPAPTTIEKPMSARWALEHDPLTNTLAHLTGASLNHKVKYPSDRVLRRLEATKPGENAWTANLPEDVSLKVKSAHLSMIYRRLVADEPAYTITGNGGGGTHGYHWEEPRALTNRERARLQSFPDTFEFHGSDSSIRKQIGMAVPPMGSKIIFEALLKTYAGLPYDYIPESTQRYIGNKRRLCVSTLSS